MREIHLTSGGIALVDDEDFDRVVETGSWYAHKSLNTSYATQNYRPDGGKYTTRRMHSFITGLPYVDHVNGNGLDNRRANLRAATASQNQANQRMRRDNRSGFRGVQHAPGDRWRALLIAKGQRISLGYYDAREDAARAYDAAAIDHFGEFARTNFPRENYA
ncbi:HNH endonuclease [Streptomyces cacaoi]